MNSTEYSILSKFMIII